MISEPHINSILGVMSGTSLDGLDLALVDFQKKEDRYGYTILETITIPYPSSIKDKLISAVNSSALDLQLLNNELGNLIGEAIKEFLESNKLHANAISSHGHTIFHQPHNHLTVQIGSGACISAKTRIQTVCDFRSLDVALNGQGAPLVPIGDKLLFSDYDACLNFGGIANISFDDKSGKRIAFDICFFNIVFNYLSRKSGKEFDEGGKIAESGKLIPDLVKELNSLSYYKLPYPKSLGIEEFNSHILPLLEKYNDPVEDLMHTFSVHFSEQIAQVLEKHHLKNALITGGGAFNSHLLRLLRSKTACNLVIPDDKTINFKEAVIFAFLGYLRLNNTVNTLKSVTGADKDSIGGAVYLAP